MVEKKHTVKKKDESGLISIILQWVMERFYAPEEVMELCQSAWAYGGENALDYYSECTKTFHFDDWAKENLKK